MPYQKIWYKTQIVANVCFQVYAIIGTHSMISFALSAWGGSQFFVVPLKNKYIPIIP